MKPERVVDLSGYPALLEPFTQFIALLYSNDVLVIETGKEPWDICSLNRVL